MTVAPVRLGLRCCLSLRQVAATCAGQQPPLSVRDDLLDGGADGTHNLRGRLVELMADCR